MNETIKKDTGDYPTGSKLNLLQSMGLLALLGLVVTLVLRYFFA